MSAGDIDDRLGSPTWLRRLEETNDKFASYLRTVDDLPIIRAPILFGGGISKDGRSRYIDPRLDTVLDGTDLARFIALHESVEWALREYANIGTDYASDPSGHRLANRAEYAAVEQAGIDWDHYDSHLDPQLRWLIKQPLPPGVPKDLALYPYEHDEDLLDKIRESQFAYQDRAEAD